MEAKYTLRQLASSVGINRRTIRYYISQDLLPPACGEGRGSYYTEVHLERLQMISRLKCLGRSLSEIKSHLDRCEEPTPLTWVTYDVAQDVRVSFSHTSTHERRDKVLKALNNVLEPES